MDPNTHTLKDTISFIKSELKSLYPDHEAQAIAYLTIETLLNKSKSEILVKFNEKLDSATFDSIVNIVERLKNSEPIQYCLGETWFYDLKFKVEPGILIPRPETEELVHLIINENKQPGNIKILDIGTGSGCIAVSLSKNIKSAQVSAIDVSETALKISSSNARLNETEVTFIKNDILEGKNNSGEKFDVIVSNPPYVLESEKELMRSNVLEHEPELALFVPDNDPLRFYKAIIQFSTESLNPNGKLYFEINENFGSEIVELLKDAGFLQIEIIKDIHEKDRMIKATFV